MSEIKQCRAFYNNKKVKKNISGVKPNIGYIFGYYYKK